LKVRIKKYTRQITFVLTDIAFVYLAIFIGLFCRFEGDIPVNYQRMAVIHGFYISVIFIILFFLFGLYHSLWEYAGLREIFRVGGACVLGTFIVVIIGILAHERLPFSVSAIACLALILLVGGVRILYRVTRRISRGRYGILHQKKLGRKRAMIVGAGDAGSVIIREMLSNPEVKSIPVVVVDDDRKKQGRRIHGIKIEGGSDKIPEIVKKYNVFEIIFAILSTDKENKKRILKICSQTRCDLKMMSSVSKLLDYTNISDSIRAVKVEDLLGRDEVDLNVVSIAKYLNGKTVIITGGGGSIGSEIARQVIKFYPKKMVILDIYENNVFRLLNELRGKYGKDVEVDVVIASIRDIERLENIFLLYKPDVVFHAAAHKHVPLMETNPEEAVKNNVLGTLNTAQMASKYNVKRFVLISTDKAVNPTSIMGATKRIAEMIVQSMNKHSKTEFMAVRFGNVLGSDGSVIPLFQKQIEAGGPVTVTHPDIKRYFMTISEAAQLVIQAGAMAKGGEVFVLDMGEMVKIIDLAKDLIKLSGLTPDEDIKIEITGLRPGDKMFEELTYDKESIKKTQYNNIYREKSSDILYKEVMMNVELLIKNMKNPEKLREILVKVVPNYTYKRENVSKVDNLEK